MHPRQLMNPSTPRYLYADIAKADKHLSAMCNILPFDAGCNTQGGLIQMIDIKDTKFEVKDL